MQQCVQIYLGLNFNSKNIEMLHEIKNPGIRLDKMLFTASDIDILIM